jgi:hypothetical protein
MENEAYLKDLNFSGGYCRVIHRRQPCEKQIILTAIIASLAGVCAAYAQEPRDFSLPAT